METNSELIGRQQDWTGLILRVALGGVIFPHGAQKLVGWFGGFGFTNTMHYFTETVQLPWIVGLVVILLESIGTLALIAGLGSRVLGGLLAVLLLGITITTRLEYGFFMNWFGNQKGEGYEFFILGIGLALGIVINGGGCFSLDYWLAGSKKNLNSRLAKA